MCGRRKGGWELRREEGVGKGRRGSEERGLGRREVKGLMRGGGGRGRGLPVPLPVCGGTG